MRLFHTTQNMPTSAAPSHSTTHHSLTNLLLERLRGLFLVVLIPLILAFLLVLGCAPTATTSASAPSELQQVANLITAEDASSAAVTLGFKYDNSTPSAPIINITGFTNTHTGTIPSWTLNIAEDPNIAIGDRTPISVRPTNLIEAVTIPPKTLTVTFGTAPPVDYMLHIYISGAPIADWFTGPDIPGGGKDVSRYITASFGGLTGSVALSGTTLSVTGFTNTINGSGSIVPSPTFPAGFSFDDITLPDPDGDMTGQTAITPSATTLTIKETGATTNTADYTLATIALTELGAFLPSAHITVKETGASASDPGLAELSYETTPPGTSGANGTILITSPNFINTLGDANTYTLTVAPVPGKFTLPGGSPLSLTITEPPAVSPGLGTLAPLNATIVVLNEGDSTTTTYNVEVMFNGAAITSWFTATTIGNYFSGATFGGQAATLTLGADKVITLAGDITNVPDGVIVLTPNMSIPTGFEPTVTGTLTDSTTLTDPDGAGVGAVTAGPAGTLTLTETGNPLANSEEYTVQISLTAYTSPVMPADVTGTFSVQNVSASSVTVDGATITIADLRNIIGASANAGTITIAGSGYTVDPLTVDIPNPEGIAAMSGVDIRTVTVTSTASGLAVSHAVVVDFLPALDISLRVTSADVTGSPVAISSTATDKTVTVSTQCQVLTDLTIAVLIGGTVSTTHSVANPPVYYDRSVLSATIRDATPTMPVPRDLRIVNGGELVASFPLIVEFPPCELADVTSAAGTATDPYQLSKPEHLELMAHLVNNSNADYGSSHYELIGGIDLDVANAPWTAGAGGIGFTPIGTTKNATASSSSYNTTRFKGTFDCKNNVVSNLYINNLLGTPAINNGDYSGLFGFVGTAGKIKNCRLESASVKGSTNVGILAGRNHGMITSSYAIGAIDGATNIGGLAGVNGGTITDAYATITVVFSNSAIDLSDGRNGAIGGLVGVNSGTINTSYATGSMSRVPDYVTENVIYLGGLVGENLGPINNSYSTVVMDSGDATNHGGFAGRHVNSTGIINKSYSIGFVSTVQTSTSVGGFIGILTTGATVTKSYWANDAPDPVSGGTRTQISDSIGSGTSTEVFSRTRAQMRIAAPVTTGGNAVYVGWDTTSVWLLSATGYPRLRTVVCANRQYSTETSCGSIP